MRQPNKKILACAKAYDSVPALSANGEKQTASSAVRKNFSESFKEMGISRGIKDRSINFLYNISVCYYTHKKFGCGNV